jgi:hypothetical protein
MAVDDAEIAAYVDAAADVHGIALMAEHRAGVIAATARLAAFAADVADVDLGGDIEVAGVFVP